MLRDALQRLGVSGSSLVARCRAMPVASWLLGPPRELVGEDDAGNAYYRRWEQDEYGDEVEVRWREKPSAPTYDKYDPFEVNVEWDSWLRRTRDAPPTRGEIEELDIYRKVVAERAAALDRAHAKKKLEAEDARAAENAEAPPQDRLGSGGFEGGPSPPGHDDGGGERAEPPEVEYWTPGQNK